MDKIIIYNFPIKSKEIKFVAKTVSEAKCFIANFDLSGADMYDPINYLRSESKITIFFDRNIVSHLVGVGRVGECRSANDKLALFILIFSQCADFLIDPSISSHEYASAGLSLSSVREEILIFRAMDNTNPRVLFDIATGRKKEPIKLFGDTKLELRGINKNLKSWSYNYIHLLKIAEISRLDIEAHAKFEKYLEWIEESFIMTAASLILGSIHFSGKIPGGIRKITDSDKKVSEKSLKNSAWDLCYLQEFRRNMHPSKEKPAIFCTFDKQLQVIGNIIFKTEKINIEGHLYNAFGSHSKKALGMYRRIVGRVKPKEPTMNDLKQIISNMRKGLYD